MLEPDYSSSCQIFCAHCAYPSVTKRFTPQCSLSWREGPQRWSGAKPSFYRRGNPSPEKWRDKKVLVVKLVTLPPNPVFMPRRGLKTRFLQPPPPTLRAQMRLGNHGAGGCGEATPQNSCSLSVSYIRVKDKISFERKGFTVNKHLENHHMAELTSNKKKVKREN